MPTHYDADLRLFINGSWRIGEGRDASGVINPATGETIAELPLATAADLDEALACLVGVGTDAAKAPGTRIVKGLDTKTIEIVSAPNQRPALVASGVQRRPGLRAMSSSLARTERSRDRA